MASAPCEVLDPPSPIPLFFVFFFITFFFFLGRVESGAWGLGQRMGNQSRVHRPLVPYCGAPFPAYLSFLARQGSDVTESGDAAELRRHSYYPPLPCLPLPPGHSQTHHHVLLILLPIFRSYSRKLLCRHAQTYLCDPQRRGGGVAGSLTCASPRGFAAQSESPDDPESLLERHCIAVGAPGSQSYAGQHIAASPPSPSAGHPLSCRPLQAGWGKT